MDNTLGEIRLFAGKYPPSGWLFCDGSTVNVTEHSMLYALIGNTYGGDSTAFRLPDLRGRIPVGVGMIPGLSDVTIPLGLNGGTENEVLKVEHLPVHSHNVVVNAYSAPAFDSDLKDEALGGANIYTNDSTLVAMAAGAVLVDSTGGGKSHTNVMPVQALNYMICVDGVFPINSE